MTPVVPPGGSASEPSSSGLDLTPILDESVQLLLICAACSRERLKAGGTTACDVCRLKALEAEVDRLRAERREITLTVAGYLSEEHRTDNALGMIHRLAGNLVMVVERLGEETRRADAAESRLRALETALTALRARLLAIVVDDPEAHIELRSCAADLDACLAGPGHENKGETQ